MDSSQWKAYGKIDPELEALLPSLPPIKSLADYGDANDLRQALGEFFVQMFQAGILKPAELNGVEKKEIQIPTRDGASVRALHYRPEGASPGPVLVYFHGGGFVVGAPEGYESAFEVFAKQLGVTSVSVDYRMAPEHKFPTAANDSIDAVKWVAENASALGADPSKGFIVGGDSAGANLAAVASHEAVDSKLSPPLTGVFLRIPYLVHHEAVPEQYQPHYNSWEDNKDSLVLDQRGMVWFLDNYKPDAKSPYASPLLWPSGHKNQPPTYFQISGMDPLRDDGLIYEHHLRVDCGVPTKADIYPGMPHGAWEIFPMLSIKTKVASDVKSGMEWLLSQKS